MIHDNCNDCSMQTEANRCGSVIRRWGVGWHAVHSEITNAQMKDVPTLCDSTSSCMIELFTAIQTDSIATVGT
jgi:hypothetical protein